MSSLRLPSAPLARFRLLFLVLASLSAALAAASIALSDQAEAVRAGGSALSLALTLSWVRGYRRGRFELILEPVEAFALLLILHIAPGEPFLPLLGLCFRCLYGGPVTAGVRYVLWMGALIGAHAHLGRTHIDADIARALGTALGPVMLQALVGALRGMERTQRRLISIVQNSTDVITIAGADRTIRWQAASIRSVLAHDPTEILGTDIKDLVHPDDRPGVVDYFAEAPLDARTMTLRVEHGEGGYRLLDVVASNRLHDPSVAGFVLNMRDATERYRLEDELRALAAQREHDAMHDSLTGLANRRRLFSQLEASIAAARTDTSTRALLLIDLDHFKELNDTLGHAAGDRMLREIGPRLLASVPEAELVARAGGDEFAVLLGSGIATEQAVVVAARLGRALEEPFRFQGMTLLVRASVGIAVFPEHGLDVETLMQRADIAMYSAKARGIGHEVYCASRDGHSRARLALIGELPEALETGQIVVHYQPKFDLRSGAIAGAEALVRWDHPELGLVGPGAFLPLAEQTGMMRALTLSVLDDALAQCARWREEGFEIPVAVNLGAPNLLDLGLPIDVAELLAKWNVPPSLLVLEITETIVAADPVRVIEIMHALGALGVALSLDDFGTGSSSLAYLRELPVQELKIDKSFVLGMEDDSEAAMIVRTVVELAHNLGLRAVGEGIETQAAYQLLAECGCDYGQGFLMGRPMPAAQLTALAGTPA